MKKIALIVSSLAALLCACEEYERGQYPVDSVPPGSVSNVKVENIAGGALISYTIPSDKDLLYVKAIYKLDDGQTMEQKASAFSNKLRIEGLGKSKAQTIQLVCGDRSKNESAPVTVEILPLDAPIHNILSTVKIAEDFGGIRLTWDNPGEDDIVLVVLKQDSPQVKPNELKSFYTKAKAGKGNLRGLPSVDTNFKVYIRDRWNNYTDTLSGNYLPLYEEVLDKSKFVRWNPTGIPYYDLASEGWIIERIWDGKLTDPGYSFPLATTFPANFTFDMGQTANLSRFKLHQRQSVNTLYSYGNPKIFEVYGSATPSVNENLSTWVKLGEFESFKPSGRPAGETTQEDLQYAHIDGEDFDFDINLPPVRYIRFVVKQTWGGNNPQLNELTFYGSIQKK